MFSRSTILLRGPRSPNTKWYALGILLLVAMVAVVLIPWPRAEDPEQEPLIQNVEVPADMPIGEIHVPMKYRQMLMWYSNEVGVPYGLMARIAQVESGWNPKASNGKDFGLFQLNGEYLEYFSWKFNGGVAIDPFDAETNMKVACRYMRHLYLQCHDYRVAAMFYNAGANRILNGGPPPKSTLRYVELVFGF